MPGLIIGLERVVFQRPGPWVSRGVRLLGVRGSVESISVRGKGLFAVADVFEPARSANAFNELEIADQNGLMRKWVSSEWAGVRNSAWTSCPTRNCKVRCD